MISARIEQQIIRRKTLAHSMGVPHSTIYAYEKRPSCSTANLLRFCHAMRYNFFADVARSLPAHYAAAPVNGAEIALIKELQNTIAQQTEELKKLTTENNLFRELMKK